MKIFDLIDTFKRPGVRVNAERLAIARVWRFGGQQVHGSERRG
jgi:hypothetical protein